MNKQASLPQRKQSKVNTAKVSVLVPRALLRKVERIAKRSDRSLSKQIVLLTEKGIEAEGVATA